MLFHIVVYAGITVLGIWMLCQKKAPKKAAERDSQRLFFLIALAGNTIGMLLSIQKNTGNQELLQYILPKKEAAYSEELLVHIGEEEREIRLLIPEREPEKEEQKETYPEEKKEQSLEEYIADYNQEQEDSQSYYLPRNWEGKSLQYHTKENSDGRILTLLMLAASILILVLKRQEGEKERLRKQEEMLLDYPGLIMKFTLLVQAGMSVRKAFYKLAEDGKGRKKKRQVYENLLIACNEMDAGRLESDAYRRFGERCGQMHYRIFAVLLTQNLRSGGRTFLELLERESMEAWEERKRKARIIGEKASTKLLIPMGMMLLVVLAVILIPAFLNF